MTSKESKEMINLEKSLLKSNIEAVELKSENNVKVITEELEEAVTKFNTYVSKTREDLKSSQQQSEKDFQELLARNDKEIEMLRLRYSNERKSFELELKEDNKDFVSSENSLIDLFRFFKFKSEKITAEASDFFKKILGNYESLEEKLLGKKRKDRNCYSKCNAKFLFLANIIFLIIVLLFLCIDKHKSLTLEIESFTENQASELGLQKECIR